MWRKFPEYQPHDKEVHRKGIKNGMQSFFWFDSWCAVGRLHDILGDRGYIDLRIKALATLAKVLATHH